MNVFTIGRLLTKLPFLLLRSSCRIVVDGIDVFGWLGAVVIVTVVVTTSATSVSSTTTSSIASASAGIIVIVHSIGDTFHICRCLKCSPVLLYLVEIEFLGFQTCDFLPNKLDLFDFQFKILENL